MINQGGAVPVDAAADAQRLSEIEGFLRRHPMQARRPFRWPLAVALEIVLIIAVWQYAIGTLHLIDATFFPAPLDIAASLVSLVQGRQFVGDLTFSLGNYIIGVVAACVVGIVVGLAIGLSGLLDLTARPLVWAVYAIPKVALAPVLILTLGLGTPSKLAMVFLLSVFPVLINTMDGVRTVDPSLVRAGRVFGFRRVPLARRIILPATLPFVIVGLRRAIALGFIGEVLGEFLGSAQGIGVTLQRATYNFQMADALAVVVIMLIASNIGLLALDVLQRIVAPWSLHISPGHH